MYVKMFSTVLPDRREWSGPWSAPARSAPPPSCCAAAEAGLVHSAITAFADSAALKIVEVAERRDAT